MRTAATLWALVAACGGRSNLDPADGFEVPSGDQQPPDNANEPPGGVHQPGNASGGQQAGVAGATSSGATSSATAGTAPTAGPSSDPEPQPDPEPPHDLNCSSDHAKGGMACTMPCVTSCGYYDLGTRSCDCVSGVFVSCHCPRPLSYQGRTTAPPCNTPDGWTHWLDNTACTEPWAQCIGSDPVSGTNPKGCLCQADPVSGRLEWTCGSTNKWFLPE